MSTTVIVQNSSVPTNIKPADINSTEAGKVGTTMTSLRTAATAMQTSSSSTPSARTSSVRTSSMSLLTTSSSPSSPLSPTAAASTTTAIISDSSAVQQLTTISLMLEYDIDNTLNALKENATKERTSTTNNNSNNNNSHNNNSTASLLQAPPVIALNNAALPPTPPATPNLQTNARKRWRILAKVLRKDSSEAETWSSSGEDEERSASVRRFKSFDLLRQDSFEDHSSLMRSSLGKPENWYKYHVLLDGQPALQYSVNIHHMQRQLTASDLMGFNNTGNICVWPSEEALTAFVLADVDAYRGQWVLELGGGFTCLSGLVLAKYAQPYAVHLTDGNAVSVENVRRTLCLNELSSCYTKCSVLQWEDVEVRAPSEAARFDTILCADCLFFDEARSALIDTIWYYLAAQGVALVMAPRRGKTLAHFVEQSVRRGFRAELTQRYNETIWQRHLQLQKSELYDEDLHYPILIRLTKVQSPSPLIPGDDPLSDDKNPIALN